MKRPITKGASNSGCKFHGIPWNCCTAAAFFILLSHFVYSFSRLLSTWQYLVWLLSANRTNLCLCTQTVMIQSRCSCTALCIARSIFSRKEKERRLQTQRPPQHICFWDNFMLLKIFECKHKKHFCNWCAWKWHIIVYVLKHSFRFGYCTNTMVKIITVCDASVKDSELVEVLFMFIHVLFIEARTYNRT